MTPERRAEIEAMGRDLHERAWITFAEDAIEELLAEIDRLSDAVLDAIEHDAIPYNQQDIWLVRLYNIMIPYYQARESEHHQPDEPDPPRR